MVDFTRAIVSRPQLQCIPSHTQESEKPFTCCQPKHPFALCTTANSAYVEPRHLKLFPIKRTIEVGPCVECIVHVHKTASDSKISRYVKLNRTACACRPSALSCSAFPSHWHSPSWVWPLLVYKGLLQGHAVAGPENWSPVLQWWFVLV